LIAAYLIAWAVVPLIAGLLLAAAALVAAPLAFALAAARHISRMARAGRASLSAAWTRRHRPRHPLLGQRP